MTNCSELLRSYLRSRRRSVENQSAMYHQ